MTPRRRRTCHDSSTGPDLLPIVRLWVLRLLVPLSAQRGLLTRHGIQDEGLALVLGLGKWTDDAAEEFDARAVRAELRELHAASEQSAASAKVPAQLRQNIIRLADLVGLTEIDRRILEFAVMLQNERALDDTADHLGQLSSLKVYQTLAVVLGLPHPGVRAALEGQGMLARSGLLALERGGTSTLRGKLNLLSDRFADHVSSSSADPIALLRDTVLPSHPGHLGLADFDHLSTSLEVLRSTCARRWMRGVPASTSCCTAARARARTSSPRLSRPNSAARSTKCPVKTRMATR